jgi:hypothetical protein
MKSGRFEGSRPSWSACIPFKRVGDPDHSEQSRQPHRRIVGNFLKEIEIANLDGEGSTAL